MMVEPINRGGQLKPHGGFSCTDQTFLLRCLLDRVHVNYTNLQMKSTFLCASVGCKLLICEATHANKNWTYTLQVQTLLQRNLNKQLRLMTIKKIIRFFGCAKPLPCSVFGALLRDTL